MLRMLVGLLGAAMSAGSWLPARAVEVDQALIDAAKKEGRVVWYTTLVVNQFVRPAAEAFERMYGIKVDYVRADSAEVTQRIIVEAKASKVQSDISDGFSTAPLIREGYVERWHTDSMHRLPNGFYDPEGAWIASNINVLTPGFNTELVPKGTEPKTYDDLLDPKWKGKMAWSSLGSSSSANGFVGSVLTFMGQEKGTAYLQKLAKQDIANVAAGARQVMDQVIAGEYPIALQMFNKHAVISAAQGAPAGWIPMLPMTVVLNVDSLTANAPHPNAGKLFLSFLLSQEGQELFRDTDYIPADPKVPPRDPSLVPNDFNSGAVTLSPDNLDAAMPKWSALYRSMFK